MPATKPAQRNARSPVPERLSRPVAAPKRSVPLSVRQVAPVQQDQADCSVLCATAAEAARTGEDLRGAGASALEPFICGASLASHAACRLPPQGAARRSLLRSARPIAQLGKLPSMAPSQTLGSVTKDAAMAITHYAPAVRTGQLLSKSLPFRRRRMAAADMVSANEAASLLNTRRTTVIGWTSKGRAVGLVNARGNVRLPRWQFEPMVWKTISRLSRALGTTNGWALLAFLESPHEALGGRTPRQAVEQGEGERVIAIARQEVN